MRKLVEVGRVSYDFINTFSSFEAPKNKLSHKLSWALCKQLLQDIILASESVTFVLEKGRRERRGRKIGDREY